MKGQLLYKGNPAIYFDSIREPLLMNTAVQTHKTAISESSVTTQNYSVYGLLDNVEIHISKLSASFNAEFNKLKLTDSCGVQIHLSKPVSSNTESDKLKLADSKTEIEKVNKLLLRLNNLQLDLELPQGLIKTLAQSANLSNPIFRDVLTGIRLLEFDPSKYKVDYVNGVEEKIIRINFARFSGRVARISP